MSNLTSFMSSWREAGIAIARFCTTRLRVSRLKAEYWRARAEQIEPYDPHVGPRG